MYLSRVLKLREPWSRIIGIPIVATVIALVETSIEGVPLSVSAVGVSILITGIIWQGCYSIIEAYHARFPGFDHAAKRTLLIFLTLSVYIVGADMLIRYVLDLLGVQENCYFTGQWGWSLVICLGTAGLISTLYHALYFFAMWKRQAIEAEALKSRQLRTELDMLKNQVSPHFLFNSLNTLVALITEDPTLAMVFTKDLSHVYRYIVQHKEREVVDLGTELDFTQAYINLMKVRFADSLNIRVDVASEHRQLLIAPLTLQLLLENALKHNVASTARPLQVDILVEDGPALVVRNSLYRKQGVVEGTGTGLSNVRQRYAYLSERPVDVIETRDHFLVALPLLRFAEHEAHVR